MKVSGQLYALAVSTLGNGPLVPDQYEAGQAPELVWMFWRREKSLAPAGIEALDCPARSLVTIPTLLSQLHMNKCVIFNYA
jgi:hypothetical protein